MNAMKKIFTLLIIATFLVCSFAVVTHADSTPTPAGTPAMGATNTPAMGSAPCSKTPCTKVDTAAPENAPLNIHLNNPLAAGGVSTIGDAINKILSLVIRIALPIIILMFIWSGLSFIFARGNPEKIKVAKNMFLYTIIGTLLILGAWTITNAIIGTVNAITGY
jgi:hypothetical protein